MICASFARSRSVILFPMLPAPSENLNAPMMRNPSLGPQQRGSHRLSDYNINSLSTITPGHRCRDFNNFDLNIHSTSIKQCFNRRRRRRHHSPKWPRHSISMSALRYSPVTSSRYQKEFRNRLVVFFYFLSQASPWPRNVRPVLVVVVIIEWGEKSNDDDAPFAPKLITFRTPVNQRSQQNARDSRSTLLGGLSDKQFLASGVDFFTSCWYKSKRCLSIPRRVISGFFYPIPVSAWVGTFLPVSLFGGHLLIMRARFLNWEFYICGRLSECWNGRAKVVYSS